MTPIAMPLFVDWLNQTALNAVMNDSLWLFAVIQSFHLIGMVLLGGALLVVDLSVLGIGFPSSQVHGLARGASAWAWSGLALMTVTGVLMFVAEPEKCYTSPVFWWKMGFFVTAVLLAMTLRRRGLGGLSVGQATIPPGLKLISVSSLALWISVAVAGRAIGFY